MKFFIRKADKKGKIINEKIIEASSKDEAIRIILDRLNISVINAEDEGVEGGEGNGSVILSN